MICAVSAPAGAFVSEVIHSHLRRHPAGRRSGGRWVGASAGIASRIETGASAKGRTPFRRAQRTAARWGCSAKMSIFLGFFAWRARSLGVNGAGRDTAMIRCMSFGLPVAACLPPRERDRARLGFSTVESLNVTSRAPHHADNHAATGRPALLSSGLGELDDQHDLINPPAWPFGCGPVILFRQGPRSMLEEAISNKNDRFAPSARTATGAWSDACQSQVKR